MSCPLLGLPFSLGGLSLADGFPGIIPNNFSNIPWLPWRKLWWKCRFHDVSGGQKITYYSQRTWPKWMVLYRLWRFSHKFEHPKSTSYYSCLQLMYSVTHVFSVVDLQGTVPVSSSELSGYIILRILYYIYINHSYRGPPISRAGTLPSPISMARPCMRALAGGGGRAGAVLILIWVMKVVTNNYDCE